MSILGVLTLIGAGLIVAALAFYLVTIAFLLWRTSSNLKKVQRAVEDIGKFAEPIGPIVSDINSDLSTSANALAATLGEKPKAS